VKGIVSIHYPAKFFKVSSFSYESLWLCWELVLACHWISVTEMKIGNRKDILPLSKKNDLIFLDCLSQTILSLIIWEISTHEMK
jgi:hypothetical protein